MRFYQSAGVVRTALTITNGVAANPTFTIQSNPTSASVNSGTHAPIVKFKGAGWNTNSGSVEVGTQLQSVHNYWTGNYANYFGQTYPDFKIAIKNSDSNSYVEKFAFSGNGVMRLQSGGGINFHNYGSGSGVTSNTLDDYEEGSWTPLLHGYWSSGWRQITIGSGTVEGATYTRVGRLVYFKCYFSGITMSGNGPNTYARIYGLPFQCANDGYGSGTIITHSTAFENTNTGNFYISPNASDMIGTRYGEDDTGYARWSNSSFYMMLSGMYQAA